MRRSSMPGRATRPSRAGRSRPKGIGRVFAGFQSCSQGTSGFGSRLEKGVNERRRAANGHKEDYQQQGENDRNHPIDLSGFHEKPELSGKACSVSHRWRLSLRQTAGKMPAARTRRPRTQCGRDVRAPKGRRSHFKGPSLTHQAASELTLRKRVRVSQV